MLLKVITAKRKRKKVKANIAQPHLDLRGPSSACHNQSNGLKMKRRTKRSLSYSTCAIVSTDTGLYYSFLKNQLYSYEREEEVVSEPTISSSFASDSYLSAVRGEKTFSGHLHHGHFLSWRCVNTTVWYFFATAQHHDNPARRGTPHNVTSQKLLHKEPSATPSPTPLLLTPALEFAH